MEIIERKDNFLIGREELVIKLIKDSTPSFQQAKEEISTFLKKDPNLVVIKRIDSFFGKREFNIKVFVYNDLETKNKFEKEETKQQKN